MLFYWFLRTLQRLLNWSNKALLGLWWLWNYLDTFNEAFWLSVLSAHRHEKIIVLKYKRDARYRTDKMTRQGFFDWEEDLAKRFVKPDSVVVIIGAGGGREVLAFFQRGHAVFGYEQDMQMVAYANDFFRKEQVALTMAQLPANAIPDKPCHCFWFGWGVYTHVIGRAKRVNMLMQAKTQLLEGGCIVLSYWRENRPQERIDRINRMARKLNRRPVERGESFRSVFWSHYFTPAQIEEEATLAGLRVVYISEEQYGHAVLSM